VWADWLERILSALELHSVAVKFAFKCLYCHFDLDVSRAAAAVAEDKSSRAFSSLFFLMLKSFQSVIH